MSRSSTDRYRWLGVQMKLAAAIREGAPGHTIIARERAGRMTMIWFFRSRCAMRNVIYNFHFYEPHIFTHQGATWSVYYWHWLRG
jgi:endoglucanase